VETITARIAVLGIDTRNVEMLFSLLDANGDGHISIIELIEGFNRLKGPAHSIDVHQVLVRVNALISQQTELIEQIKKGTIQEKMQKTEALYHNQQKQQLGGTYHNQHVKSKMSDDIKFREGLCTM